MWPGGGPVAPGATHVTPSPSAALRAGSARGLEEHGHRQIPHSACGSVRNDMNPMVLRRSMWPGGGPVAPGATHVTPSAARGLEEHGYRQIPHSACGSVRNDMNHMVLRSAAKGLIADSQ